MKLLQFTKPNGEEFIYLTEDAQEAIAEFAAIGCELVSVHAVEHERGETNVLPTDCRLQVA